MVRYKSNKTILSVWVFGKQNFDVEQSKLKAQKLYVKVHPFYLVLFVYFFSHYVSTQKKLAGNQFLRPGVNLKSRLEFTNLQSKK